MGVFQNNLMGAAAAAASAGGSDFYDYQIANSVFLNGTSQSLRKTWGSAASDDNKKALSFWIKRTGSTGTRSEIGSVLNTKLVSTNNFDLLELNTNGPSGYSDQFGYTFRAGSNTNWLYQKWRDPSAWMHIIWIWNSDESTTTDRIKFYLNGVNLPIADSTYWNNNNGNPYPNSGEDTNFGKNGNTMHIADYQYNNAEWFGGQMADFIMIDGAASYTDFGEFKNGVWKPVDPSGLTFGNNGFHLNFASSGDLGNDVSGNNNDFSVIGSIPASAQLGDSPTFNSDSNGGNFMTYNGVYTGANNALAEGNLKSTGSGAGNNSGTFGMLTGKWYWECRAETVNSYAPTFGIGQSGAGNTDGQYYVITWQTAAGQMYGGGGVPVEMGTITVTNTGVTSLSSGDILSFWLDCDNRKLWIGKNGTIPNSGNPATGANPQASWATTPTSRYFTATCQNVGSGAGVLNAGQNPSFNGGLTGGDVGTATDKNGYGLFKYDPSGTDFIACCAANILTADEVDPAQTDDNYPQKLFNTVLYTGNGSTQNITGVGFKPDLAWIKRRNATQSHRLADSTRGAKTLYPDDSIDEDDMAISYTSDGFDWGSGTGVANNANANGGTYVAWNWRANGGTTSTNSAGSLSVTQQVDPSGSFSISTYSGDGGTDTIGHGLSRAPTMVIVKQRNGANNWAVYAKGAGATKYAYLDSTGAFGTAAMWQNTTPSSSLVYLGDNNEVNAGSRTYVAYCFADTEGFIKSGSYVGNGSGTDGTFVYTGFKPAFLLIKKTTSNNWRVQDSARDPFNPVYHSLLPNSAAAEDAYTDGTDYNDFLSNGFKLARGGDTANWNASGSTYIYLAFAENPFQYATAR